MGYSPREVGSVVSTHIVNYSDLVSDDNRCPSLCNVQKPQQFKTVVRAKALSPYKLRYDTLVDVDTKIQLLIDKINSLPERTFFSVGSLTASANRQIAIAIGKEIAKRCFPKGTYVFVSAYPGKWIYQRTNKHLEAVKDFAVDMVKILNDNIMNTDTNPGPYLHLDFTTSLADILRHVHGVKYFPTRVVQTKPLGLPEGDYSVSLGWRLKYPQGPFTLRLTSSMSEFDVCAEIAKLFENQYGIKDPKHCYPNSAVLIRPERLDEEILMKDYDNKGNENDGIVSTPFLEGVGINTVNKVVQVSLGT